MHAIVIHEGGGPEVLRYEEAPAPEPANIHVLVKSNAASANHDFLSSAIPLRFASPKIIGRGRRGDTPFECGGAPRVAFRTPFAAEEAPQKINEKNALRENRQERSGGDECTHRRTCRDGSSQPAP